ncbi:ABC transporter ATP-binding protein [Leucobacter sp. CSA1]|uniref:ABC transporter ATP-binding protein n=2 Tax=Leucobacter chromiisoli TaxID=2796471 RepID=A0A934UUC9_9MICO|nr:ABC transporter ATP-binding protein [Leucobacter chromiisoli]
MRSGPREAVGTEAPWVLRAEGLGKRYGSTDASVTALADAHLEIGQGEAVAIMGPSGSGKSTLLHAIAGIIAPDEGRVLLRTRAGTDGGGAVGADDAGAGVATGTAGARSVDLAALSDDERSALRLRRFGFVFQQGMLLPELTASENVELPLLLAGFARSEARQRSAETMSALGIGSLGGRRIGRLSGGQAQRIAIARALIADPQLIFADEPTGALDSRTANEVLDALLQTGREPGARALVVVTHDERVAARCDRTVRLRDGRIEGPGAGRAGSGEAVRPGGAR